MKQSLMLAVIVILVLWGTVVVAQPDGTDSSQRYMVEPGEAAGGGYRLTGLAWQVSGTARGGSYSLLCPHAPSLRGSGCCCTYLPATMRSFTP